MDCERQIADALLSPRRMSAWRYEQEGRNLIGRGRVVGHDPFIDELIAESPDAFVLFSFFAVTIGKATSLLAKSMADHSDELANASRKGSRHLVALGLIEEVVAAGPPISSSCSSSVQGVLKSDPNKK